MSCPAITPAVDSLWGLNRFGVFIAALKKLCSTRTGANLRPGARNRARVSDTDQSGVRQVMMEKREFGEVGCRESRNSPLHGAVLHLSRWPTSLNIAIIYREPTQPANSFGLHFTG